MQRSDRVSSGRNPLSILISGLSLWKKFREKFVSKRTTIIVLSVVTAGLLVKNGIAAQRNIERNAVAGAAVANELRQWKRLFDNYQLSNGKYPLPVAPPMDPLTSGGPGENNLGAYCLGTGFPSNGTENTCHSLSPGSPWRVSESTGAYLIKKLSSISEPPINTQKYIFDGVVGPLLWFRSSTDVHLLSVFPPGYSCSASDFQDGYGDSLRQECVIQLDYILPSRP